LKRPPLPPHPFTFRPDSQDFVEVAHVMLGNEYRLPERFGPDDVVIDVGANIGSFAVAALARGAGKVVAVEPSAANYDLLVHNFERYWDRANVLHVAVWAPGVASVPFEEQGWHTSMGRVGGSGPAVRTITLDRLIELYGPVRFLKLDCEGAEWPILHTAERLGQVREIAAEVHPSIAVDGYDCRPEALVRRLTEIGFVVEYHPGPHEGSNGLLFARRKEGP
jgi:FkbM family methyltransferase